jgi:hypothetical protein
LYAIAAARTDLEVDRLESGFGKALRAFRRCLYAKKQRPGLDWGQPFRDQRLWEAILKLRTAVMDQGILLGDPERFPERAAMARKIMDLIHAAEFVEKSPADPLAGSRRSD